MSSFFKITAAAALFVAALLLGGCTASSEDGEGTYREAIDIAENVYVSWINEIYTNTESYIGASVKIEGMYGEEYDEFSGQTYYYVYRVGPGCCENDGAMCGFEILLDEIDGAAELVSSLIYDDWIRVSGKIELLEEDGAEYIVIMADEVVKSDQRGSETVK